MDGGRAPNGIGHLMISFMAGMIYVHFLHARPWIPGDEKSIFTVVIH